jgi:hypothetical protein
VWNNPTMLSLRASLAAGVVHSVCHSGTCKYVVGSRASEDASPARAPKPGDFDEKWYVAQYFDVRDGIARGRWTSGLAHYRTDGHREFRARNARDWDRLVREQQETSVRIGAGYRATLSWLRPPHVRDGEIVMSVSAVNSGSIPWRPKGQGPTPILVCAESYRRLEDVQRTVPMYAYRIELPGVVQPGQSVALDIQAPASDFPIGPSFLVVDLVCDAKAVRFTSGPTRPLVLGVHRDEWTDQIELVEN